MSDFIIGFLNLAIFIAGILLIGLILIQRGKGGGLAGAFGGAGGSSAVWFPRRRCLHARHDLPSGDLVGHDHDSDQTRATRPSHGSTFL